MESTHLNGYTRTDLSTNIENSRNSLRRIARPDGHESSKESIIKVMEKFVKTVNQMDETILVPCRLMDRQVGDSTDIVPASPSKMHSSGAHSSIAHLKKKKTVHDRLNSADLFNLYTMLNTIKTDLLWGKNNTEENGDDDTVCKPQVLQSVQEHQLNGDGKDKDGGAGVNGNTTVQQTKGHIRRPSTVSMASSNSTSTLSDSDSEISNENDSGIESENNPEHDKVNTLARQYRTHLVGLYKCLEQMTEAANYLSLRYQNDVGSV